MDFIINRIEKIEYSLAKFAKCIEELKSLDTDAARLTEKYSLEKEINSIEKHLKKIKCATTQEAEKNYGLREKPPETTRNF